MYSLGAVNTTHLRQSKTTFRNTSEYFINPQEEIVLHPLVSVNKQKGVPHTLNLHGPWTLDHAQ